MTSTVTATPAPTEVSTPNWSSRSWHDQDRDEVLALFTESDFYFRTEAPDTRPEWEILALLDDDTRVLLADGRLAGLYALENDGSTHGCHYRLHLRLRAAAPLSWWQSAYREVVRAARWQQEMVRLAMRFLEFDDRGLRAARTLPLVEEGTLTEVVVHDGRRRGEVFFAQIWVPAS